MLDVSTYVRDEARALSNLKEGERIVARLLLRSLGPDWSQAHLEKAHARPGMEPRDPSYTYTTKPLQTDGVTMAILGVGALSALRGYFWMQDGETWKAVLLGAGSVLGIAVAGWAWWRWKRSRSRVHDPILVKEKVSRIAFDAELQVTAILPPDARPQRGMELLDPVATAYRHHDNPAGARFNVSRARPVLPNPSLHPKGPGLFGKRSVLGVREVAALWHPPGAGDETPLVERSGARVLLPSARAIRGGALVGDATAGTPTREIRFPEDLLRRHHLYVARTRMGKSTLMHHVVAHKMREKAAGRDSDAIVDPHTDLVSGLLEQVPLSLADDVRLIDLADDSQAPGINLLDTRIFSDRDRTADSVVRVAKGLWDQWGPRMQSILEQTVKTLHEANEHPSTDADEQYTILDGLKLLSDETFKDRVLAKVSDPYLLEWWARDFSGWHRQYKAEALAPVQTRLSYYASSKRARAILGQSRSTIDMRQVILQGGVLLVSTSQGTAGRDVAALVGASILNLVDAVIREQGGMPLEKRRGALVVVDEMQSMPGVDYESMLSELGKFGASFILATQSLAKLNDLSRTMQDTLLANIGCLAVFQVAGADARTLVWELGKERVSEEDITSLPVHHCYVRSTVSAAIDLRAALDRARPGGSLPTEPKLSRASLPWDISAERPGQDLPDYMLPSLLKSLEKRTLDLLSDWPLISRRDLASLLAVSEQRASQLMTPLEGFGLVTRLPGRQTGRLALTDLGLALLARRDHASLGIAKRRWSVAPLDTEAPIAWRNVSGARSRQLLRNAEHTDAVHGFVAALARQSRSLGWEIVQLDPPRKASRYFRYGDKMRSIHPDAFGVLSKARTTWPFFLEWERRAVRPTTMAARLAPYLRYYSSHRPTDDHGARPAVLVVFDDDLAATHFLRVAREEMDRTGVRVPLWVSHRTALAKAGPLGRAWRTPEGSEHVRVLPGR